MRRELQVEFRRNQVLGDDGNCLGDSGVSLIIGGGDRWRTRRIFSIKSKIRNGFVITSSMPAFIINRTCSNRAFADVPMMGTWPPAVASYSRINPVAVAPSITYITLGISC